MLISRLRKGMVIEHSEHGRAWVVSATDLREYRERFYLVTEGGDPVRCSVDGIIAVGPSRESVQDMRRVILSLFLRASAQFDVILDSEGGWSR